MRRTTYRLRSPPSGQVCVHSTPVRAPPGSGRRPRLPPRSAPRAACCLHAMATLSTDRRREWLEAVLLVCVLYLARFPPLGKRSIVAQPAAVATAPLALPPPSRGSREAAQQLDPSKTKHERFCHFFHRREYLPLLLRRPVGADDGAPTSPSLAMMRCRCWRVMVGATR